MKFSDAFIGTAVLLMVLVFATIYAVPARADDIDTHAGPILSVVTCRPVLDINGGVDPNCKLREYTMDKTMDFCELVAERLNTHSTTSSTISATCEFQH